MSTAKDQFCGKCGKNITYGMRFYIYDSDEMTKLIVCSDCWTVFSISKNRRSALRTESSYLIEHERERQISLWGDQLHLSLPVYHLILSEEKGELAEAILETLLKGAHPDRGGLDKILKEAVQTAAVAQALVENVLNLKLVSHEGDEYK